MSDANKTISAKRFRIGVLCIALFWLPLPALITAYIASPSSDNSTGDMVLIVAITVQSILGLVGVLLAGKPVYEIVKQTPKRKVPLQLWQLLRHGMIQEVK